MKCVILSVVHVGLDVRWRWLFLLSVFLVIWNWQIPIIYLRTRVNLTRCKDGCRSWNISISMSNEFCFLKISSRVRLRAMMCKVSHFVIRPRDENTLTHLLVSMDPWPPRLWNLCVISIRMCLIFSDHPLLCASHWWSWMIEWIRTIDFVVLRDCFNCISSNNCARTMKFCV